MRANPFHHAIAGDLSRYPARMPRLSRNSSDGYTPYLRRKKRATRQYARIIHRWVERAGRDGSAYGRIRCGTKAAQIYRKMGNLRSVQLLRGQTKLESTVRYLGIEVDDALTISEQVEL